MGRQAKLKLARKLRKGNVKFLDESKVPESPNFWCFSVSQKNTNVFLKEICIIFWL